MADFNPTRSKADDPLPANSGHSRPAPGMAEMGAWLPPAREQSGGRFFSFHGRQDG